MYSAQVLDHLENPRNVGELADPTGIGFSANPICGDMLHLQIKVTGDKISDTRFKVQGCPPSIAAGSILTELIAGLSLDQARALRPRDITAALGSLPRNKEHCAVLAIDALRAALAEAERRVA